MHRLFDLIATLILVGLSCGFASAQVACNGILSGSITSSVICSGDCILDGATISGNVECSIGTLVAKGNSIINGNILSSGLITRIELDAVTVLGAMTVTGATSLTELVIKQSANLRSVTILNTPGDTILAGSLTSLEHTGSGRLFANDLSVTAIVIIKGGSGIVELCGSVVGGLSVQERVGDIEINANNINCAPTTLNLGLTATKGSGRVRVIGASLPSGDFIVSEYIGDIDLQEARVSDIQVVNNTGSLTIISVLTDSDTSIFGQLGDVTLDKMNISGDTILQNTVGFLMLSALRSNGDFAVIKQAGNIVLLDFNFIGDVSISEVSGNVIMKDTNFTLNDLSLQLVTGDLTVQNVNLDGDLAVNRVEGNVALKNSSFMLEDVSILLITGDLTVKDNTQLNLLVQEISGMVQIIDNVIMVGSVNKNTSGVKLCGNVVMSLSCTDNVPAPFGSGNVITFAIGQCATGL